MQTNGKLVIKEVSNRREKKRFIRFPYALYKDSPFWVPPLVNREMDEMSPGCNPAFEHCEAHFLLAVKNGKIAGRIAGIINHRYNDLWNKKMVRFYWFDFIDDLEVSGSLLKSLEKWAVSKGMEEIMGPMGFTTFERQGMLIEGFDRLPSIASAYNHAYYPDHLVAHGYIKDHDYVEYTINVPENPPEKSSALISKVTERYRLHILNAKRKKDLLRYDRQVFDLLNRAYSPLHGFVPLTEKQVSYFLKKYRSVILPGYSTAVLDENDQLIGFQIAMPSLSKAFQKAKGRLFPFGFLQVAKAIRKPEKIDLLLVGVVPEYQNKGVSAFFFDEITKSCIRHGIRQGETTGMLEDNVKVLSFVKYYDGFLNKRRRLFIKNINHIAQS